jgi:hypothetical protein
VLGTLEGEEIRGQGLTKDMGASQLPWGRTVRVSCREACVSGSVQVLGFGVDRDRKEGILEIGEREVGFGAGNERKGVGFGTSGCVGSQRCG